MRRSRWSSPVVLAGRSPAASHGPDGKGRRQAARCVAGHPESRLYPHTEQHRLRRHFARKTPLEDGGERIVLATDRYISFWEQWVRPRTIDYPFTVIEMRINRDGTGEGKLSLATRIEPDKDKHQIVLEDYGTQPVLLTTVRKESITR